MHFLNCSTYKTSTNVARCAAEGKGEFLATAGGLGKGLVLRCSMEAQGALDAWPTHHADLTALRMRQSRRLLVQGFSNGVLRVSEAQRGSNNPTGL